MKLKKILAAVAAAAVAVSTMAVSAFAIKDYPDGYTLDLIAEGYDVTSVAGFTFKISGDIDSGVGGGVGFNSATTGWDSTEWGNDDANKAIKASNGEVTIKRDAPVFKESDVTDPTNPYAQIWMQQWWGSDVTIDAVIVLDKDGNELKPAAPAAEAEAAPAVTVELDAAYPGDWAAGKCISKSDLEAIGGDVKVVLTVEVSNVADDSSYLFRPMDFDNSWTAVTDKLTAEQAAAKPDGMMQVRKDQTTVEFVVPAATVSSLGDSGLGFQVCNVTVKSAEISAGAPENPLATVEDSDTQAYCNGTFEPEWPKAAPAAEEKTAEAPAPAAEEAEDEDVDVDVEPEEEEEETEAEPVAVAETEAPAVEEAPAPAVENATAAPATGNTAVASIVTVMAVAGVAAIAAKKRK